MAQTLSTSINRRWTAKMALIAALFLGFGCWFLYDATIKYPHRGAEASEYFEMQYLESLSAAGERLAGIDDPVVQHRRLASSDPHILSTTDRAMKTWLDSLNLIGRVSPEFTRIPRPDGRGGEVTDARSRLDALRVKWTTVTNGKTRSPNALSTWDIPSQWAVFVICMAVGLYILYLMIRVRKKVYRWEPDAQRLTLHDGAVVTPADLADIDKRLWDKLYVVLKLKDAHPQYPGREYKLDLLRYEPLEEWVLAMERTAFPDRAEPQPAADEPGPGAAQEPEPAEEHDAPPR